MNLIEVFEGLKVKPDLESVFRDVTVEKLTASRSSGQTIVHLISRHLLEYRQIKEMEHAISEQFFGRMGKKAQLSVTYQLSAQYNPQSLWKLYKESVIEEVGEESRMASFLLKKAEVGFEEAEGVFTILGI